MTSATIPPAIADTPVSYAFSHDRWLVNFLKVILRAAVVLGALMLIAAYLTNTKLILLEFYATAYIIVLLATFLPIPYRFRAGLFLLVIYSLGVSGTLEQGIYGDARLYFPIFIIVTTMLFERRATLPAVILIVITGVSFGIPIINGKLPLIESRMPVGDTGAWIIAYLGFVVSGILVTTGLRMLQEEFERSGQNAVRAIEDLAQERSVLDQRIKERTVELENVSQNARRRAVELQAISEVARAIAQLQDINKLLPDITKLISEHVGFYHVGIFLLDENKEFAVLRAANSEGGQHMLARGHRLRVGQVGIVGYVAQFGEPRIALDVGTDAVYFENPDLPQTRSEMALPLKTGNFVIGVLDIQSEQAGAFSQQDTEMMNTLADQVTIAIENARLFGETRRALNEAQVSYGRYLEQSWKELPYEIRAAGYRYTGIDVEALDQPLDLPEIQSALDAGKLVTQSDKGSALAVPLKIRGEVIGVLDVRATDPERQWSENELILVQGVADRVALAMETARLFGETSLRAERERSVSEITTRIRSTSDPQIMLRTTLDELKRVLGAGDVQIRPYNPNPVDKALDDDKAKDRKSTEPVE